MDFAADAVLDSIAPSARQSQPRAHSVAVDDEPSFDEHLDTATREPNAAPRAEPTRAEQAPEKSPASNPGEPADSLLGAEVEPVASPARQVAAEQTTSPLFVQLITAAPAQHAEPQQQTAVPSNAQGAPSAPAQPAPPAPMQIAANTQDAPASAPSGVTTPVSKPLATGDDSSAKSVAPAVAPAQTAPAAAPVQTGPASPAPIAAAPAAPATQSTEAALKAAAPVQMQSTPEHGVRQPKSAAPVEGDGNPEAPATPGRAAAPMTTAAPRTNAKATAPPNTAAKEAAAFSTFLDAPEAAPQQQTSATPTSSAASSNHTQHAAAEHSARAAPAAHQVAREIVRRFDSGNTRFELRLDPPEMGRVEVRLDVSRDHRVTAVIAADSPQALTELARHARDLEQMLQGAGLELGDNGLSFDLRQGSERAETAEFSGAIGERASQLEDTAPVAARPLGYERWRGVRVDVMV